MPHLAIIIVSWNTRELLRRCITTIHTSLHNTDINYRIIVVDNASSDGTPTMLRADHAEVELIESGENLGFAGGNNLALRRVLQAHEQQAPPVLHTLATLPDYVLLLNPDTEVCNDAIPQLVRYLETHPDVALVGPQLRYPDGSIQSSRRRFPTRATYFCESTPLEQWWTNNPWVRRYRCTDTADDHEQKVDWLVGAALLVRRSVIERVGLLDASFHMYSEELEWQRRIHNPPTPSTGHIPQRIVYLPSAQIIHHEGKSSEQARTQRYLNFQRSRLRDARMVYGQSFASILKLFVRAAYTCELATEGAKWLLGHKRALRAQRMGVYWRLVRQL